MINNNIHFTELDDIGMKLDFINGSVIVPKEPYGYVISTGCGSGKTSVIKKLIEKKFTEGILYSAFTIEECQEMYDYCLELVDSINDPEVLSKDDIIVLHSDYNKPGTDKNLWERTPSKVLDKKILICTHHKLMNEDPMLLCATSFNRPKPVSATRYRMAQFGLAENDSPSIPPRQLILIDELPIVRSARVVITERNLLNMSMRTPERFLLQNIYDKSTNKGIESVSDDLVFHRKNGIVFHKTETYDEFRTLYEIELNDKLAEDPTGLLSLDEVRSELIAGSIYDGFDTVTKSIYRKTPNKNGERSTVIRTNFLNIIAPGMSSTVLLFDGTGDLTFYNSSLMKVLTFKGRKYNSPIELIKIHSNLRRKSREQESTINANLQKNIDQLVSILNENEKTLIVTWKNLKDNSEFEDESGFVKTVINESKSLTEFYRSSLEGRGFLLGRDFEIIHYQSGLDKATNKFMNCDSIVFLGEFHVPDSVIDEFNNTFKCNTNPRMYLLYQLAQATCRTRIRLHNGDPIRIYFTDDWNDDVMRMLGMYLTEEDLVADYKNSTNVKLIDNGLSWVSGKIRKDVLKLADSELLPGLKNYLVPNNPTPMRYKVPLKEIHKVLPRSEYKVRSYKPIQTFLSSISIDLIIESESDNHSRS